MIEAWLSFFWSPTDLTSLAVFRVLAGCLVVADALSYASLRRLLLDPASYVPHDDWSASQHANRSSLLRALFARRGSTMALVAAYGLCGLVLAVGFAPPLAVPLASLLAFALSRTLRQRNPLVAHSGDILLGILLVLLAFTPCTETLSLAATRSAAPPQRLAAPALRLMQVQLSVLYTTSVLYKLRGATWRKGTATHYVVRLLGHRKRRLPAALDTPASHRVATYATLAVEFGGGLLVWFPATRYPALLALAGLHLTLQLLMRMHLFQWIMLSALVLFIPGEDMARFLGWLGLL